MGASHNKTTKLFYVVPCAISKLYARSTEEWGKVQRSSISSLKMSRSGWLCEGIVVLVGIVLVVTSDLVSAIN